MSELGKMLANTDYSSHNFKRRKLNPQEIKLPALDQWVSGKIGARTLFSGGSPEQFSGDRHKRPYRWPAWPKPLRWCGKCHNSHDRRCFSLRLLSPPLSARSCLFRWSEPDLTTWRSSDAENRILPAPCPPQTWGRYARANESALKRSTNSSLVQSRFSELLHLCELYLERRVPVLHIIAVENSFCCLYPKQKGSSLAWNEKTAE